MQLISTRFFIHALLTLLAVAGLIIVINQYTDIDLMLADLYFDPNLNDFPWRKTWFAENLMHDIIKNIIIGFGLFLAGVAILDLLKPINKITSLFRTQLRIVAFTLTLAPLVTAILKHESNTLCPWSIDRYGGSQLLLRLLDRAPIDWIAGHCFPAGHVSVGAWLAALAVFWLPHKPLRACVVFLGGISVGLTLGWVQQMRGAHFLTHTLTSLWISCAVLLVLTAVIPRLRVLAQGSLTNRIHKVRI